MSDKALSPEEVLRKLADPRYWIQRSLYVIDQAGKKVPFIFNPVQNDYYEKRTSRDIIVKARKQGFSTETMAEFAHACANEENTYAVIVSHEEGATQKLLKRAAYMVDNSAIPIRVKVVKDEIRFLDTNSLLWIGTAGQRSFGRGDDITHAHFSEVAHYENNDLSMLTGVQEALVKGRPTVMRLETTANGAGTPFHELWLKAVSTDPALKSAWTGHFYGWWQDALNVRASQPFKLTDEEAKLKKAFNLSWEQLAWFRWKPTDMLKPELFTQEYPATWEEAFLSSGKMLFDWAAIKEQEDAALPVKWRGHIVDRGRELGLDSDPKGPLMIWRTPQDRVRYLIVADAAEGIDGEAYSCADVYDMRTWEQVAQYHGHVDPATFGDIMARMGAFYNWAHILIENETPGNAVIQHLVDMVPAYPNVMADPDDPRGQLGFPTTEKTRAIYIADGRDAVKDLDIKINSPITFAELRTFALIKGKMKAQSGCFQDTVIVCSKAASILKKMIMDPETPGTEPRDFMRLRERLGRQRSGSPKFRSKVV